MIISDVKNEYGRQQIRQDQTRHGFEYRFLDYDQYGRLFANDAITEDEMSAIKDIHEDGELHVSLDFMRTQLIREMA